MLHELARIHLEIDAPKRRIGADDPDWILRVRKVCLHALDPTPWSLAFPLAEGGFGDVEDPMSYLQFAVWLGRLGVGYGLALTALAQVLGAEGDVASRVALVMRRNLPDLELPSLTARTWWSPFFVSNGG